MAESRLIGGYPVIGIRPTIDGRRGPLKVRESLEDQTMNMAKAAKALFEENLRYSNGEPVKVVIADTTIGRVAEAAACAAKFKKEGVDITLSVTPCWCYGSETMDMDPNTIKAFGASTLPKDPAQFILQQFLQLIHRRVSPHSVSTARTFRMLMTLQCPMTLRKSFSASHAQLLLLQQ